MSVKRRCRASASPGDRVEHITYLPCSCSCLSPADQAKGRGVDEQATAGGSDAPSIHPELLRDASPTTTPGASACPRSQGRKAMHRPHRRRLQSLTTTHDGTLRIKLWCWP